VSELEVFTPQRLRGGQSIGTASVASGASPIDFRMTVRTRTVLAAVAKLSARGSSPNNREIAQLGGVRDRGQISRLLARLADLGLLVNTGEAVQGTHNAWRLTASGREILDATDPSGNLSAR
jgi:hypothetical protein